MDRRMVILIATLAAVILAKPMQAAQNGKPLDIYFIDVEGGQSTLFVSPSGQTMLVDTGWAGDRDAGRITDVARQAGVSRIDYLVITHYHGDHVGGVPDLASRIPIRTFVDHGSNMEETPGTSKNYSAYVPVRDKGKHLQVKPGDKVPVKGFQVTVVAAAGDTITKSLPGAGAPNPACSDFQPKDEVKEPGVGNENKRSVAMVIALGKFRMADFGDLTWNKEHDLACPNDLVGTVDLFLVSHHGLDISNLPALVRAMQPRVAIMNNGARKGAAVVTFETLKSSPGFEDLWQLHYAEAAADHNAPEQFIANTGVGGTPTSGVPGEAANYIKIEARPDGSFTVTNSRNGFHKEYGPRT